MENERRGSKKRSEEQKHSQNSEAFLWMDKSIKKKRKCKRGYGEKLGENSPLERFSPETKKNFELLFRARSRGE